MRCPRLNGIGCDAGMPMDHRALLEGAWQGDPTKRLSMDEIVKAIDRLTDISEPGAPVTPTGSSSSQDQIMVQV
jgi:hypothetical protein